MLTLSPLAAMCRVSHGPLAAANVARQSRGYCRILEATSSTHPWLTPRTNSGSVSVIQERDYLRPNLAAERVSLFHTSTLFEGKFGDKMEQKIIKAWRNSPMKPIWDNNAFLNRNFIERFELKLKHPMVFLVGALSLTSLPDPVFYVLALSTMFYVIKNRKFY